MKLTIGRLIAHIVGGGIGLVFGFNLPIMVVLLFERGHELEISLSRLDTYVGGDFLIELSVISAIISAYFSSRLLAAWIYPKQRAMP
ncbi:MAG: hypothetical protein ACRYFS_23030 [Janthinobacterium lividum]